MQQPEAHRGSKGGVHQRDRGPTGARKCGSTHAPGVPLGLTGGFHHHIGGPQGVTKGHTAVPKGPPGLTWGVHQSASGPDVALREGSSATPRGPSRVVGAGLPLRPGARQVSQGAPPLHLWARRGSQRCPPKLPGARQCSQGRVQCHTRGAAMGHHQRSSATPGGTPWVAGMFRLSRPGAQRSSKGRVYHHTREPVGACRGNSSSARLACQGSLGMG